MSVRPCDQGCGSAASGYAIDPRPGGWGGHYCTPCTTLLGYQVVDRYCPNDGSVLRFFTVGAPGSGSGWDCEKCGYVQWRTPLRILTLEECR